MPHSFKEKEPVIVKGSKTSPVAPEFEGQRGVIKRVLDHPRMYRVLLDNGRDLYFLQGQLVAA